MKSGDAPSFGSRLHRQWSDREAVRITHDLARIALPVRFPLAIEPLERNADGTLADWRDLGARKASR